MSKHIKVLENAGLVSRGRQRNGDGAVSTDPVEKLRSRSVSKNAFKTELPADEPIIIMSRVIDAPLDLVWTEPEHVVTWWGLRGDNRVVEYDFRRAGPTGPLWFSSARIWMLCPSP